MRPLNTVEQAAVSARRAQFDAFYSELMPVLVGFIDRLGITPAHAVLTDAVAFAPLVSAALRDMRVETADDRVWLVTRVGYFVGEYLVQNHGGCWFVNDDPDSATFARFVVGRFAALGGSQARVDPFAVAADYTDGLPGADFAALLADIDVALVGVGERAR
jgi:hypothetical protein